jgi:hypothetical protein
VRFSTLVESGPGSHPASCTMGLGHSQELSGRGMALTTRPFLAPRLKKEYSSTSTLPLGLHGLLWGELHLYSALNRVISHFCL